MSCPDIFNEPPTDRGILLECIKLVKQVSWRAEKYDFNWDLPDRSEEGIIKNIQSRENEGSWATWYGKNNDGDIDKVAFFQQMLHEKDDDRKHPWILCIGFDRGRLEVRDPDIKYTNLLDEFSRGDFGLYSFVKNCMEKNRIFVVELPKGSDHRRPETYDFQRDKLLRLAINSYYVPHAGREWKFSGRRYVNHPHWKAPGDGPCILYRFKQR